MDDVIKHTCFWPLTWYNKYEPYYSLTLLRFLTFLFTSQREGVKQWMMKGLTKVQWINHNQNNRSVLVCRYCVLWEKTGPILPPLVGLMAGRHGGRRNVGEIWNFEILYRLNYSGFYFVYYHCSVTTVLELHFSQLLLSKAYFKVCF